MSEWLAGLHDFESMTAGTVYLVIFTLVFVESGLLVGFFLPGDTVLFGAGLIAASDGSGGVSLPVLATGVFVCAVAGDAVGYWSGRRFGRPWVLRRAGRGAKHLERAEAFYDRWGAAAVVVARFIPWVRTFTPIVAGVARMPYPRFLAANLVGAVVWGIGLTTLGYVAHSEPTVRRVAYVVAGTAVALSLLVPLSSAVRRARAARRAGPAPAPAPARPAEAPPEPRPRSRS